MTTEQLAISEEERDILQEIMNIAFGKAASDLAELIDINVILSVPSIKMLPAADLAFYLRNEIVDQQTMSIVEQNFWGKFKGSALLIFPSGAGKELLIMLETDGENTFGAESIDILEKETLMEVGNIIIGACVGKITELLGDCVTYSPPKVVIENHPRDIIPSGLFDPNCSAIVLKTVFCLKERNINGYLFLLTSHESIGWLKMALDEFMEQYE
jgi:chemotaxis protein CheC